jgi:hypothetical protein
VVLVIYFYKYSLFHNTHQVLGGLPRGVGGFAILYFISFHFIFCFDDTHQVLVGLPQGVGGPAILFYLFCFSLFLYKHPRAARAVGLLKGG